MDWSLYFALGVIILGITLIFVLQRLSQQTIPLTGVGLDYYAKDFPTPAEERIRMGLEPYLKDRYLICPQVAVPAFLGNRERKDFNKIRGKYIDFLIRKRYDRKAYYVLEVNDSTHDEPERIKRDQFLKQCFTDANIPYKFLQLTAKIDFAAVARDIEQRLG